MTLVLDASIAVSWCFPDERTATTQRLLESLGGPETASAPRLWAYEVRNVILRGVRQDRIGLGDAEAFLDALTGLPIRLLDPPYEAVFTVARQFDLSFYDAAYLELAAREHLPLSTLDRRLCIAAAAADVPVYSDAK